VSTQSDGIEHFTAEVERRGGFAERIPGRKLLFEVSGADGQTYCVKLKTKSKSKDPWQGSKKDGYPGANPEADAWVFIDNQADPADAPVAPADFMRNDIARELELWLQADPSRNADKNDHHKIDTFRVEDWAGRWDLIGLDFGSVDGS